MLQRVCTAAILFGLCVDTDECETANPCNERHHEECVNTAGSYVCRCRWGWRRGRSGRCVADPTARAAASALRGGEEVPGDGPPRGVWEVLEDILVPTAAS